MRKATTAIALATLRPDWASTSDINGVHEWLHDEAVLSYGYSVLAQYSEIKEQRGDFSALLDTYQTVDKTSMRRKQRSELFQSGSESSHCISEKDQSYTDVLRITETHCKY